MVAAPHLRFARPREAGPLTELAMRAKAHWGYGPEFMAACRAELTVTPGQLAAEDRHYVIALRGSQLLGFYGLSRSGSTQLELEALFVDPAYIGTGIGRSLIDHARIAGAAMGGETMLIQGDPHARGFYLAMGAEPVGERESDSVVGRMLPLFRLSLATSVTIET